MQLMCKKRILNTLYKTVITYAEEKRDYLQNWLMFPW
jgi:hypothetical protein